MLCNDAGLSEQGGVWHLEGAPTDGALLTLALKDRAGSGGNPAATGRAWT